MLKWHNQTIYLRNIKAKCRDGIKKKYKSEYNKNKILKGK